MRRPAPVVVVLAAAALLASCSSGGSSAPRRHLHVIGVPNFALPPTSTGCGGVAPAGGGSLAMPLTVSRVGTQVAELVNVCLDGEGPFPFVVDTGAAQSAVDLALAQRLRLSPSGQGGTLEGIGCVGYSRPYHVADWTVEGLTLAPQSLIAARIPGFGGTGQPVGLLGADVWSRFGAVRFDLAAGQLVVPGQEGPQPSTDRHFTGPTSTPTPAALLRSGPGRVSPLSVLIGPGLAITNVTVALGGHSGLSFGVDTGSSQSVIESSEAASLGLRTTDTVERQTTVCSTITVPVVPTGHWSLARSPSGAIALRPLVLASTPFGAIGAGAGFVGLVGSDQLIHFGWFVLDYAGGRLVVGPS